MRIYSSIFVILFQFGIAMSQELKESEELRPEVEELSIEPHKKLFIHSVGDSLVVVCTGNDVKWKDNEDTYIDSKDNRQRIYLEDDSSPQISPQHLRLIFNRIEEVDQGEWTCQGQFEEKSFRLAVYVPIEFVPVNQLVTVKEGHDAKLNCKANGRPTVQINWLFNGIRLTNESERFILESDGLVIKNVTRDDAGDYICKAYQVSSKVSDIKEQIIALDVHFKPEIIYTEKSRAVGKLNPLTGITLIYASIESEVNLTCEAIGNPTPYYVWYHGKKRVYNDIVEDGNSSILQLYIKTNRTFGDYRCKAKNEHGHDYHNFTLEEGDLPKAPSKFKLLGVGNDCFDIDIDSKTPNLTVDPLAITQYRFEIIKLDDYINNGAQWKKQNITDQIAKSKISYIINKLMPNTTYLIRVASINAVGLSNYTESHELTTLLEKPIRNGTSEVKTHLGFLFFVIIASLGAEIFF